MSTETRDARARRPRAPSHAKAVRRPGDRIFSGTALAAGPHDPRHARRCRALPVPRGVARLRRPGGGARRATAASSASSARCCSARSSSRPWRCCSRRPWPSGSRCTSRTTPRGGWPRPSATSSTCWPPCPASSSASGACRCSRPTWCPAFYWLEANLGFIPLFDRPDRQLGPGHADGRARPGRDDPADHDRRLPRGVPADAAAARGGRSGARGHPLGDDHDGGAALRPLRRHLRGDARPGPGAGRDPRRDAHPRGQPDDRHLQPDQLAELLHHPGQHRPRLPRGDRAWTSTPSSRPDWCSSC